MLSDHERRVLEELERSLRDEAGSDGGQRPGPRRPPRDRFRTTARLAAVVFGGLSVLLLVTGAASGALALALATAIGAALWHCWPQLGDDAMTAWPEQSRGRSGPRTRPDGRGPSATSTQGVE